MKELIIAILITIILVAALSVWTSARVAGCREAGGEPVIGYGATVTCYNPGVLRRFG